MRLESVEISSVHPSASPDERDALDGGNDDAYHSLWVILSNGIVNGHQIDWTQEIAHATPDEGDLVDIQDADLYHTVRTGKLPRDMAREEIGDILQDVSKAKVKEVAGLYELGCFNVKIRSKASQRCSC